MYVDRIGIVFDAGHRLLDYGGSCGVPHGHTYKAEVMVSADAVDSIGFVVDFTELKHRVKEWIDDNWDHSFLLNDQDSELLAALSSLKRKKLFLFQNQNPTAEVMARHLFNELRRLLGGLVHGVRVWESPSQYAEYFER